MKINKRRIPDLIAGVLLLSIFFVPCAGVHADDFSEEQKASIRSVVAEAISESDVVKGRELEGSVKKAVSDANKNSGSSLSAEKVKEIVKEAFEQKVSVNPATKDDVRSVKTPAWIALGVSAGLGAVCLVLLVVLLIRMPRKKDDEAEKAKRNAERDSYFNSLFTSVNTNTDEKIQKVLTSITANKPAAASEISGAVKTDVINYVKPKFEALDKKIGEIKVPQSEEIATEVFGAVSKDIEKVTGFIEETKKVIGGVNQEYGGALKLLERIQKDQKEHLEKIETDRKVFEQEKQKIQKELDEKRNGLDKEKADLVKQNAELATAKAALDRKQGDLVAKEKTLDDEKKGLDARIKQAAESAKLECKNQFAQEKTSLEQKFAQEKAALEQKSAQEKAALEQKFAQGSHFVTIHGPNFLGNAYCFIDTR